MFFHFNLKKVLAALFIILLPIVLFNLESSFKIIASPFIKASYGVQSTLDYISSGISDTTSRYTNLISIKKNNKDLLKEVSNLKMESVAYQELKLENERLKKLLSLKEKSPMSLIGSTVTAEDLLSENQTLTIDKGEREGIKEEMGVLGLNGVIGRILKVSSTRSQVLLLTDRFYVAQGIIQRSREKIIVEGTGDLLISAKHMRSSLDIQIGDLIVTSGAGGLYPKGLPIGVVQNIKISNAGITKTAFIRPLAELFNAEELFVIKDPGKASEE